MGRESRPRILMVDDEPAIQLGYRLILEQQGFEVATAADSTQARALLRERRFDLLWCDAGLETRDAGIAVVEWARQEFPEMPCVLVTGYPEAYAVDRARQAGAEMLTKPVEIPAMLNLIQALARRGAA